MKKKIGIAILVIVVMIIAICVIGNRMGKFKNDDEGQFKIVTTFYPMDYDKQYYTRREKYRISEHGR